MFVSSVGSISAKEWTGLFGIAVAAVQYVPYCWNIFRRKIRPHAFSYLIWAVAAAIVFAAQYSDNAGPGAWVLAFSACACFLATALSARQGFGYVRRGDWLALIAALASIPLWMATKNPFSAVMINTFIDMMAYVPTFRKAWHHPREDSCRQYGVGISKHTLSLLALAHYDLTTTLTSAMVIFFNSVTIALLLYRRAALRDREPDHVKPDQAL
jgi:hypothetical protein